MPVIEKKKNVFIKMYAVISPLNFSVRLYLKKFLFTSCVGSYKSHPVVYTRFPAFNRTFT